MSDMCPTLVKDSERAYPTCTMCLTCGHRTCRGREMNPMTWNSEKIVRVARQT